MWPFKKKMSAPDSIVDKFKQDGKSSSGLPVLQCAKCSAAYDFNKDAIVNTYDFERPISLKKAIATSRKLNHERITRPPEDTVMQTTCEVAKMRCNVVYSVLSQLSKGKVRKWYCSKCHHLQNYPKSFTIVH